jgi:diaminohydroxyphosphoribosylaminopyrimidine deaminase/5-amino-6-(5-phosphoribosylamino)uracil reductase
MKLPVLMLLMLMLLQVVGEGFHPKAGMPHAEVYALRAAGQCRCLEQQQVVSMFAAGMLCNQHLVLAGQERVLGHFQ